MTAGVLSWTEHHLSHYPPRHSTHHYPFSCCTIHDQASLRLAIFVLHICPPYAYLRFIHSDSEQSSHKPAVPSGANGTTSPQWQYIRASTSSLHHIIRPSACLKAFQRVCVDQMSFGTGGHCPKRNDMTRIDRALDRATVLTRRALIVKFDQVGSGVVRFLDFDVFKLCSQRRRWDVADVDRLHEGKRAVCDA